MSKGKSVKVGYTYYFGIHMGIGREVDELVQLKVGDREAWSGSVVQNGTFRIRAPNLFGGKKAEGGIDGRAYAMFGGADQEVYGPLRAMLDGGSGPNKTVPAFRGRTTVFFDGMISQMNPYPKSWAWRVRRALKGWDGAVWYPARAIIPMEGGLIRAMNPAHILVQALTDRTWGRGLNLGQLDLTAYTAAADQLFAEGFGLCFRWTRQGTIDDFIQLVLDHIGAVQALDRRTGQLTLKLIRQDYDVNNIPHFDFTNGLLAVEDLETAAFDSSTNTVIVNYTDPITNEMRSSAPVANLAAIQSAGVTLTTTTEYFGCPTFELAGRMAERDLQISMGAMRRMTLIFDRRGSVLRPGQPFSVSAPEYGIDRLIMRAGAVTDGTLLAGSISVVAIQDLFGLPLSTYTEPQPSLHVKPDLIPKPVTVARPLSASYRDLYQKLDPANLELIDDDSAYLTVVASKPSGLQRSYAIWSSTSSTGYAEAGTGDWVPNGKIATAIPLGVNDITVQLFEYSSFEFIQVDTPGRINDEEMIVLAVDADVGTVTLRRGALDTIPQEHPADSRIWFYQDVLGFDVNQRVPGQTMSVRLLSETSIGTLPLSDAPTMNLQLIARHALPFPPGNVQVNGQALGAIDPVPRPLTLTWAHRNRISQADQLFGHTMGNITPEPGTTYTVEILSRAGVTLRTEPGITGTSWTYTAEMMAADGLDNLDGLGTLRLWSVRDGYNSWQRYSIPFTVIKPGLGMSLGYYLGGEQ